MNDAQISLQLMSAPPVEIARKVLSGLRAVAQNCDGAISRDDLGFSATDQSVGHYLASAPGELMTIPMLRYGASLCRNYREQILRSGALTEADLASMGPYLDGKLHPSARPRPWVKLNSEKTLSVRLPPGNAYVLPRKYLENLVAAGIAAQDDPRGDVGQTFRVHPDARTALLSVLPAEPGEEPSAGWTSRAAQAPIQIDSPQARKAHEILADLGQTVVSLDSVRLGAPKLQVKVSADNKSDVRRAFNSTCGIPLVAVRNDGNLDVMISRRSEVETFRRIVARLNAHLTDEARAGLVAAEAALTETPPREFNVKLDSGEVILEFIYDKLIIDGLRGLPKTIGGRYDPDAKIWTLKPIPAGIPALTGCLKMLRFMGDYAQLGSLMEARPGQDGADDQYPFRIEIQSGSLVLFSHYDPAMIEMVKSLPNRKFDKDRKAWVIGVDPAVKPVLKHLAGMGCQVPPAAFALIDGLKQEREQSLKMSQAISGAVDVKRVNTVMPPFQQAAMQYALMKRNTLLALDTGTGKTVTSMATVEQVEDFPCVVYTPASMKLTWEAEINKFLPHRKVIVLGKKYEDDLKRLSNPKTRGDFVVLNYDLAYKYLDVLKTIPFKAAILDESQYVKESKSRRTVAVRELIEHVHPDTILLLSATPLKNRPVELVSQLEILNRIDEFGGAWKFKQTYCGPVKSTINKWDPQLRRSVQKTVWDFSGSSNEDDLALKLREICMVRCDKTQVLKELPPKRRATITVDPGNLKAYIKAEKDLGNFIVERQNQRRKVEAMRRSGADVTEAMKEYQKGQSAELVRMSALRQLIGELKAEPACEWIEDFLDGNSGEKLVVFAHHQSVQNRLLEHFKKKMPGQVVSIMGSDSAQKREDAKQAFQSDPNTRLIVCSFKAAQTGLTLTAAANSLCIEFDFTPTDHLQAEDRIWRIGQDKPSTVWYMTAKGTIDDELRGMLSSKLEVIDKITNRQPGEITEAIQSKTKTDAAEIYGQIRKRLALKAVPGMIGSAQAAPESDELDEPDFSEPETQTPDPFEIGSKSSQSMCG